MKAAVLKGAKDFKVENVDDPVLQPDGAIIKVKACGICGSDLHRWHQGGAQQANSVLGHEWTG